MTAALFAVAVGFAVPGLAAPVIIMRNRVGGRRPEGRRLGMVIVAALAAGGRNGNL
jgi:hypothetical protein